MRDITANAPPPRAEGTYLDESLSFAQFCMSQVPDKGAPVGQQVHVHVQQDLLSSAANKLSRFATSASSPVTPQTTPRTQQTTRANRSPSRSVNGRQAKPKAANKAASPPLTKQPNRPSNTRKSPTSAHQRIAKHEADTVLGSPRDDRPHTAAPAPPEEYAGTEHHFSSSMFTPHTPVAAFPAYSTEISGDETVGVDASKTTGAADEHSGLSTCEMLRKLLDGHVSTHAAALDSSPLGQLTKDSPAPADAGASMQQSVRSILQEPDKPQAVTSLVNELNAAGCKPSKMLEPRNSPGVTDDELALAVALHAHKHSPPRSALNAARTATQDGDVTTEGPHSRSGRNPARQEKAREPLSERLAVVDTDKSATTRQKSAELRQETVLSEPGSARRQPGRRKKRRPPPPPLWAFLVPCLYPLPPPPPRSRSKGSASRSRESLKTDFTSASKPETGSTIRAAAGNETCQPAAACHVATVDSTKDVPEVASLPASRAAVSSVLERGQPAPAGPSITPEVGMGMTLTPEYIHSLTSLLDKDLVNDDEIREVLQRAQNNLPPRMLSTVFEAEPPTPPIASYGGMSIQKETSSSSLKRKGKAKHVDSSLSKSSHPSTLQGAVAKRKSGGGASTTSSQTPSRSAQEAEAPKPFAMPSWLVQSPRLLAYQPPWERNGTKWNSVDPEPEKAAEPVSAMSAVKQRMAALNSSKKSSPGQSPSLTPRSMNNGTWRPTASPRAANSPRDGSRKATASVVVVPTAASKIKQPEPAVFEVPALAPPATVMTSIRLCDLVTNLADAQASATAPTVAASTVKSASIVEPVYVFAAPASEVSTSPSRRSLNTGMSPRNNSCRNSNQAPGHLLRAALDPLCNQLPTDPMYEATLKQVETLLAQHD